MKLLMKVLAAILVLTLAVGMMAAYAASAEAPEGVDEVTIDPSEPALDGVASHSITVNVTNGTASPNNPASVEAGSPGVVIMANADSGYAFDDSANNYAITGVEEGGYDLMISAYPNFGVFISEMPDSDVTVNVTFSKAYTATYAANGGTTGSMWRNSIPYLEGREIDFAIFDELIAPPAGKEYDGVTVNGVRYGPTDTYTMSEDVSIIYQWKNPGEDTAPTCRVIFDLNGGTAGPTWEGDTTVGNGTGAVLPVRNDYDVTPPEGYIFAGLTVDDILYAPGGEIPVAGEEEIHPVFTWTEDPSIPRVTVTIDPNGGTIESGQDITADVIVGETIHAPTPDEFGDLGITPPDGKQYAGMEYDETPYKPGDPLTVPDADFTVKILWADVTYTVTKGANATWTKSSSKTYDVTVQRSANDHLTFGLFTGISIDGKAVDSANYTAAPGSVKLSLKAAYLKTLSEGVHTMVVTFTDGSASTRFTVAANQGSGTDNTGSAQSKNTEPKTGDETNLAVWSVVLAVSAFGLGTVLYRRRKGN